MNYLTVIKETFSKKEKKVQNLIFLIVMLVLLLIAINYFFNFPEENEKSNTSSIVSNINNNEEKINNVDENIIGITEEKLQNILSKIRGIEDVSVMLTYSSTSKQNFAYNVSEEKTGETSKSEKNVAYSEKTGQKNAIVESVNLPKVEGIIIVAKGADSAEIKSKIATAAAMIADVPVYKVQVFEK